jgi:hypothetical protein
MPIKALNNYQKDWMIKARVASKQAREARNNCHILKLELVDSLGTSIEATMFKNSALKWGPLI